MQWQYHSYNIYIYIYIYIDEIYSRNEESKNSSDTKFRIFQHSND